MDLSCADPHDRLPRGIELTGDLYDLYDRHALSQQAQYLAFLRLSRRQRAPELLAFCLGRLILLFVRLMRIARSNFATALFTWIAIFPARVVKSTPPNARQCTRTPADSRCATVARTSIVAVESV